MSSKGYSKEFRMRVAKEAVQPENKGMEHIIAAKYGILPGTVRRWAEHYLENGEDAFYRGYTKPKPNTKSPREKQLEKEIEDLRLEIEILKKAAAFLANVKRE